MSVDILERNLEKHYKEKGINMPICEADAKGIKKDLAKPFLFDDEKTKEIKGVLELINEKIEGAFDDIGIAEEYKAEMKNMENQTDGQVLNAFGKPVLPDVGEDGEKKPVKFLGTFGKKNGKTTESGNKENKKLEDMTPAPVKKLKTDEKPEEPTL